MGKETLYNKKSKFELKKNIKEEQFARQTISFYKLHECPCELFCGPKHSQPDFQSKT